MNELFGKYNLRARLSPSIILISPILLNMYLFFEIVREIATTVIITITSSAIINLLVLISRYKGSEKIKKVLKDKKVFAQEMLSPLDTRIDASTKKRYYKFLNENIKDLNLNYEIKDSQIIFIKCNTAVKWLKEYTRDEEKFPLVFEENINTGFCRNLYGLKNMGLFICLALITIKGLYVYSYSSIESVSVNIVLASMVDVIYIILWTVFINKKFVQKTYEKYAIALLKSCDGK